MKVIFKSVVSYVLNSEHYNPDVKNIDKFKYDDFKLINYKHHPAIKMDVAV